MAGRAAVPHGRELLARMQGKAGPPAPVPSSFQLQTDWEGEKPLAMLVRAAVSHPVFRT